MTLPGPLGYFQAASVSSRSIQVPPVADSNPTVGEDNLGQT